jgi:nucleoside 2-deoxyribosyltransferase
VLLVNLLGALKVSIGTCMELGWADAARVPIIAVMEQSGNPHDHAMVNEVVGFRVEKVEHGLEIARAILTAG